LCITRHPIGCLVSMLLRIGSRTAAAVQTWEWQLMQVSADGMPANAARVTEA
jgi:hypothetical protein